MASHYDFYESLELDKSASTSDLHATLSQRLEQLTAEGADDSDPKFHELSTARTILGDEARRKKYDDRLADDSAAAMQISDLVHLADHGQFPGASNYSWTNTAQGSSANAAQMSAAPQTFTIQTRKVEEAEPTDRPFARFKVAPGTTKAAVIVAALVPVVMTLYLVYAGFDVAGQSTPTSTGDGLADLFAGAMSGVQSMVSLVVMFVVGLFTLLNILWGERVVRTTLSEPSRANLIYLWVITGFYAVVDFSLFIADTDEFGFAFFLLLIPRVAVIVLLSLGATRRWFDGTVETRVPMN